MPVRQPFTAATAAAVAAEVAGHPLDSARAATYAQIFEPILQAMDQLRRLPLKDIEPACVFAPESRKQP